jgi:hypothetical protein
MKAHNSTTKLLALLSLASLTTVSAAQSGTQGIAFSMQNSILEQLNQDVVVQIESNEFGSLTRSITLLLNNSTQQDRFSFDGINDAGGSNDFTNRGRNQQGANASGFVTPKTDNLNVVPLPPAALAGFGLLAGFAGIRYLRNARN